MKSVKKKIKKPVKVNWKKKYIDLKNSLETVEEQISRQLFSIQRISQGLQATKQIVLDEMIESVADLRVDPCKPKPRKKTKPIYGLRM